MSRFFKDLYDWLDNPGSQIKLFALITFALEIIIAAIALIVINVNYITSDMFIVALIISTIAFLIFLFISYVVTLFLFGFGHLLENSDTIDSINLALNKNNDLLSQLCTMLEEQGTTLKQEDSKKSKEVSSEAKDIDRRKEEILSASEPFFHMLLLQLISQEEYDIIKSKDNYSSLNAAELYDGLKILRNNYSKDVLTQQEYLAKRKELIINL